MKLPRLWRKKKRGKYSGSYFITLAGQDINLRTDDAEEARQLRAKRVDRARVEELDQVADLDAGGTRNEFSPLDQVLDAGTPAAAPEAGPALHPDQVLSPPRAALPELPPAAPPGAADADDMAAAAAEVAGDEGPANDNAPPIDPSVLDAFLRQGALVLVDAQLQLQAAIIKRRLKKEPAAIPADSPLRSAAAEAWVVQLKIWFPDDKMLPPWAMALIIPALAIPAQIASAQPMPPTETPPAQAAA